ncbi:sensor histidine kinase [Oxynema aestuarii]|uniref:Circadian input-output histidine kinase CikA n=1 Tax=Oxynema aestuarii AP17 TaxID=2064643 RepID=A0A6H1U1K4_9CYAN|nr:sensor histidine kinase [Oxynema aestuarii]QIZ72742.1 sensor histidine kinase [Oxynema aestuarii AP17]
MIQIDRFFNKNLDRIFETWKEKVREDRKITSSNGLSEPALENLIPQVLDAMCVACSPGKVANNRQIEIASLEHGTEREEQGFDAAEIAREYHLLRQTIFEILEEQLVELTAQECYQIFVTVDAVIDRATSQCFTQFVVERTSKLDGLHQQLMKNNQELNRLLTLSQDSFFQLAHEFKTPLNSIMAYSQILLREQQAKSDSDPISIEHISRVLRSSKQLLQLVNNSLEISRIQSGTKQLQLMEIEVSSVVKAAAETIQPLAEEKGLTLRVDCDRGPGRIETDISRLQQVLINLLGNGVRYTETGSVEISCATLSDEEWFVKVKDTGIGIAAENLEAIFQPFARVQGNTKADRGGSTGLGLTIVKQLVKLLQGEIRVESELGKGSTFTVIFPFKIEGRSA